jgi:hypothetical protein
MKNKKDYLEHSVKYNELLETAKKSFSSTEPTSTNKKRGEEAILLPKETVSDQPKQQPQTNTLLTSIHQQNYANLFESLYLDTVNSRDYVNKLQEEIKTKQTGQTDDSDDWLCVEAPQLDDYLEMYSKGDVSSTYDFKLISNAFKRFLKIPTGNEKDENLLEGANYESIDVDNDEKLIDFDVETVTKSLKDLLSSKVKDDELSDLTDDDDDDNGGENGSFYEVDDDLIEKTSHEMNENEMESYMNEMDDELKDLTDLSRLKSKVTLDEPELDSEDDEMSHSSSNQNKQNRDGNEDEDEDLSIDLNLVSNALESYSAQLGMTGPVSNILKSIGL